MDGVQLWMSALSIIASGIGYLIYRILNKIDRMERTVVQLQIDLEVEKKQLSNYSERISDLDVLAHKHQVEIAVNQSEVKAIRSDLLELKLLLKEIGSKLDSYKICRDK